AVLDAVDDLDFFASAILRDDQADVLADGLVRRIAEHPLGGPVPRRDDALEGLGDDRIVRRIDDRGQTRRRDLAGLDWVSRSFIHTFLPRRQRTGRSRGNLADVIWTPTGPTSSVLSTQQKSLLLRVTSQCRSCHFRDPGTSGCRDRLSELFCFLSSSETHARAMTSGPGVSVISSSSCLG